MATTIHIPDQLLARVDARAKALGVSRNRLIVQTLEKSLETNRRWSPELVQMLGTALDEDTSRELTRTLVEVRKRRINRKRAPAL